MNAAQKGEKLAMMSTLAHRSKFLENHIPWFAISKFKSLFWNQSFASDHKLSNSPNKQKPNRRPQQTPVAKGKQRMESIIRTTIDIEQLDANLFRSKDNLTRPVGARGVFGGQVIGQALSAAVKTVPSGYFVHSFHCLFLLAGDPDIQIIYHVRRLRETNNYCTRSVIATQNGRAIFNCQCSFAKPETSELRHQYKMPILPPPESLLDRKEHMVKLLSDPRVPETLHPVIKKMIDEPFPVEIRSIRPWSFDDFINPPKLEPRQYVWMKAAGPLGDDQTIHQCFLAYASDHLLLSTTILPMGMHFSNPRIKIMVSLDHSIWFHTNKIKADEWMLYEMESPRASNGRGLNIGRIFSRDGELIASCAQEGVVRLQPAHEGVARLQMDKASKL